MSKIKNINHVTLLVSDKERAKDFYTNKLGLEPVNIGGPLWVRVGDQFLHLTDNSGEVTQNSFNHFAVSVDGLDEYLQNLINIGIEVFDLDNNIQKISVTCDLDKPKRQFFIHDPDRNLIEFVEYNDKFFNQ